MTSQRLTVLDPTAEPVVEPASRAERPASLAGKRIGFLDNSKPNSDKVLRYLDEMLQERYGIGGSIHRRKPTASRVVPAELLEEMVRECDLVIPAVGD
jgi:hypothetical protein